MKKVILNDVLGNFVNDFTVTLADEEKTKVPYQLSFASDLYADRTTITLMNLWGEDDNKVLCPEIRVIVLDSIYEFFERFPDENVYFEMELGYRKNFLKFLKFYRWATTIEHPIDFNLNIEMVDKDDLLYAQVTISRKPAN